MNISAPFITRPVGTTLLTLAIALVGAVAFALLPVSPLPQMDFPTIMVQASVPGASPETMAATVATPLERSLGRIAGITEMTSSSSQGSTRIVLQFDLSRDIDGAARDVQAAINAARATLPSMPSNPTYWKMNPSDAPIMVMGLTSDTLESGELYDIASSVLSQKLSQVLGVGQVSVGGSSQKAVRVDLNPGKLNSLGISLEEVQAALAAANSNTPKGFLDNGEVLWFVGADDQLDTAQDFAPLVISYKNGAAVRLSDVAEVYEGVQDIRNIGFANGRPAILLIIYKQPGANIIETIQRVRDTLPLLRAWMPEGVNFEIIMDRSPSIKASLREVEHTLLISTFLVIMVVFLFLRNGRATFIPAVAVPVSLLGTFGVMYLAGFSLNHLSLMALTIATGFVVDDAIVVTENIVRHLEKGENPIVAAFKGSKEVAFTVVSISLSLVAIFIPLLGMGGFAGRIFKEFAVTLSAAVLVSLLISLTCTPMLCALMLRRRKGGEAEAAIDRPGGNTAGGSLSITPSGTIPGHKPAPYSGGLFGLFARLWLRPLRLWGDFLEAMQAGYAKSLVVVLRYKRLTLCVLILTMGFNIFLYVVVPKGLFPNQDTGQIMGMLRGDQSSSFQAMQPKMQQLMDIVSSHPDVASVGGFTGGGQRNAGMSFITLKPLGERKGSTESVINDLRERLRSIPGVVLTLRAMQDLRMGGRESRAAYQYTLQSDDLQLLREWAPRVAAAFRELPGITDVSTDQETRGLQTTVMVNRDTIARLGISQKQVDSALGLAFGQSFASTIYKDANQYRVVMGFEEDYLQGPEALEFLYVPISGQARFTPQSGTGISGNAASTMGSENAHSGLAPLLAFSLIEPTLTSLSVAHQGQFSATTISFNLLPNVSLSSVQESIEDLIFNTGLPSGIRGGLQGTAGMLAVVSGSQPLLILAGLVTLYLVLGVLYESLIHPLTILSTLPSAGVGAILGLMAFGAEFSIIAFIGVLLLFGIVKKNAIMMIDFAIHARRTDGLSAEAAIYKACLLRFRPIMMTTMAATLGALPLLLGQGDGAEIRTPLGISIVGGLLVSQVLTLYTTPVVYIFLDRFSRDSMPARLKALKHLEEATAR